MDQIITKIILLSFDTFLLEDYFFCVIKFKITPFPKMQRAELKLAQILS